MGGLAITGDELPGLDVGDIADGPDVLGALDAEELIHLDGAVCAEIGCRNVRGVGDQAKCRNVHVRGQFVAGRKCQFFATIRQLHLARGLCFELDVHIQVVKSLQCVVRYARWAFLEDCRSACDLKRVSGSRYCSGCSMM